jgi:hypothetical protein
MRRLSVLLLVVLAAAATGSLPPYRPTAEELRERYAGAEQIGRQARSRVFHDRLQANWLPDGGLWYRKDLPAGRREFVLVDPEKPAKGTAFDHAHVAKGLAEASKKSVAADRLPFDAFEFRPGAKALTSSLKGSQACA